VALIGSDRMPNRGNLWVMRAITCARDPSQCTASSKLGKYMSWPGHLDVEGSLAVVGSDHISS